jgi:hypothetical protein
MGEMKWLKAATKTQSEAASSSQLIVAQVTALISRGRSSSSTANRSASRWTVAAVLSGSRKRIRPEILLTKRAARSWPLVRR